MKILKYLALVALLSGSSRVTCAQVNDAVKPVPQLDWKSANRTSVSTDAHETRRAKVSAENFKTDYGTFDRDQIRERGISITVWNSSRNQVEAVTEVLWFVSPERPPKGRIGQVSIAISERTTLPPQPVRPGQKIVLEAENSAVSNRTRYEALGESYASGVKFAGWIAFTRSENKVLSFKASTPSLEKLVAAAPGAGLTLTQLIEQYDKLALEK